MLNEENLQIKIMKYLSLIILLFMVTAYSQSSVESLDPKHAAALAQFISKNKDYKFLSEKVNDTDDLKYMRETFGKNFTPYYRTGDFNKDKIKDFALILSRHGESKDDGDHSLAVVIFNGQRNGTFKQVFIEKVEVPLTCFLNFDEKLYFGVFESDADTMIFTSAGKGYIVEFPDEP